MKTTSEPKDQAKTDFHYFCTLLHDDIGIRIQQDAVTDKCFELCNQIRQTIAEAQEFYGHDAPVNESVLIVDINTFERPKEKAVKKFRVPQSVIDILRMAFKVSVIVLALTIPSAVFAQNDAIGYVTRTSTPYGEATELNVIEPTEPVSFTEGLTLYGAGDTVRVGLRLSCKEPQYIWSGYRIRVKLSDSAYGHKYLGPDKKPLPKGCQILEIIWPMKKGTKDIIPE
jgi:hypothetical protein